MSDRSSAAPGKRPRARTETTTPSKKNRRRRRLSASSCLNPRSSDASGSSGANGSGDSQTTIVWKDSPADKQIRVSGTGKLAVRKEVQGFVGRLARASAESPYASADMGDDTSSPRDDRSRAHLFSHAFTKRKAARATQDVTNSSSGVALGATAASHSVDSSTARGINRGSNTELSSSDVSSGPSRHLVFSPDASARQHRVTGTPPLHSPLTPAAARGLASSTSAALMSAAGRSDAQDELFLILDKIDEKYSSPSGALQGVSSVVTTTPLATSRSTRSSTVLQSPPPPQQPSRLGAATAADRSSSNSSSVRTSATVATSSSARSLEYAMSPPPLRIQTTAVVAPASPECGSPLTEESWDLLDQLEFQATQRLADSQDTVTAAADSVSTAAASTSVLPARATNASAPRPATPALPIAHHIAPAAAPAVALRSPPIADAIETERFARYVVLEVDCDAPNRRLLLQLLDARDALVSAVLTDDWFDTVVEPGDTVNIVFTEIDSSGFAVSQLDARTTTPTMTDAAHSYRTSTNEQQQQSSAIVVDNSRNVVVVHPDVLVSPTNVTTSFECLRRAILREALNVTRATHRNAFLGTLKHELFESALKRNDTSAATLQREAERIVASNIVGLVDCKLDEQTALQELQRVIPDFGRWVASVRSAQGLSLLPAPTAAAWSRNQTSGTAPTVRVHDVLATEEMMWSTTWGLKGATDASVMAAFTTSSSTTSSRSASAAGVVVPVELKTGDPRYNVIESNGQVMLYTLLLNERYRQQSHDGLLLYAQGMTTTRVAALATPIRSLVLARNKVANALAKVKALGSATATASVFPPMLQRRSDCARCFQIDECVLHHAAVEHGSSVSSGLDELFTDRVAHLSELDLAYFRRWLQLLALEQQHAEKHLRALWLHAGWKRERALASSACVAGLRLVADDVAVDASRTLWFERDPRAFRADVEPLQTFQSLGFRVDDRLILSAESVDGTRLLVHVARGHVVAVDAVSIAVRVRQALPAIVLAGASSVGKAFTWRLDKDAIVTGLNRARENLVALFIGPPPDALRVGTHPQARPEVFAGLTPTPTLLANSSNDQKQRPATTGDTRRRLLIVHLARPRFKSCRVRDVVTQRLQALGSSDIATRRADRLLTAFTRLNVDQQRGVAKVLGALDYALLLGMPGTGKTATIAFSAQLLLFLGLSVLVTSYTHSAVDSLLLKLLDRGSAADGNNDDLQLLRLGDAKQVHPELRRYTLEQQAAARNVDSVAAMQTLLRDAQLVGCTCLSVTSHVLVRERRFDFCIVDEATQTTQPVVLGALRCADTFVLVGDQYQLPPLVASATARRDGLDVSLFRRLAEAHPAAVQPLSFQYRMNRDVMRLANRLVYGGKLKCGAHSVAANALTLDLDRLGLGCGSDITKSAVQQAWPLAVLTDAPGVVFLDTDTLDGARESAVADATVSATSGRRRMENRVEAQLVGGLVELVLCGGVKASEVAVISPFRSQVALLTRTLAAVPDALAAHVEVSTIDKYQGKDKDVVVVSFVRSNADNRVGELLTDWRRINVALTRARQKLVLVGSLQTLSTGSALFHAMAEEVKARKWHRALVSDALQMLDVCVDDARQAAAAAATGLHEPEPEDRDTSRRGDADDSFAEVSVLHPSDDNDDIEGLAPNISSVSSATRCRRGLGQQPQQQQQQQSAGPVVRDILGDGAW